MGDDRPILGFWEPPTEFDPLETLVEAREMLLSVRQDEHVLQWLEIINAGIVERQKHPERFKR